MESSVSRASLSPTLSGGTNATSASTTTGVPSDGTRDTPTPTGTRPESSFSTYTSSVSVKAQDGPSLVATVRLRKMRSVEDNDSGTCFNLESAAEAQVCSEWFDRLKVAEECRMEEWEAATEIQRIFRGFAARKHMREAHAAAVTVQRVFRGWRGRQRYADKLDEAVLSQAQSRWAAAATLVQKTWRGYRTRTKEFSMAARKAYLASIVANNDATRAKVAATASLVASAAEAEAQAGQRGEFEVTVKSLHYLRGTKANPGVFDPPGAEKPTAYGVPIEEHLRSATTTIGREMLSSTRRKRVSITRKAPKASSQSPVPPHAGCSPEPGMKMGRAIREPDVWDVKHNAALQKPQPVLTAVNGRRVPVKGPFKPRAATEFAVSRRPNPSIRNSVPYTAKAELEAAERREAEQRRRAISPEAFSTTPAVKSPKYMPSITQNTPWKANPGAAEREFDRSKAMTDAPFRVSRTKPTPRGGLPGLS